MSLANQALGFRCLLFFLETFLSPIGDYDQLVLCVSIDSDGINVDNFVEDCVGLSCFSLLIV